MNSKSTLIIAFRGSDSPADVATNMQLMESAAHSHVFQNCSTGSIHRGILNAYYRVNSGTLVDLTKFRSPNEYRSPWDLYLKSIHDSGTVSMDTALNPDARTISKRKLSSILRYIIFEAMKSKRRVVITGHSLGGALATVLILHLLTNWVPTENTGRKGDFDARSDSSFLSRKNLRKLYLYTYGEVEYADESLLNCLKSHPIVESFAKSMNYRRFVSLTKSPLCKSDVVTRIATKVIGPMPEIISGKNGGRLQRRMQTKSKGNKTRRSKSSSKPIFRRIQASLNNLKNRSALEEHADGDLLHLVPATYLCSGYAENTIDAHSLVHYMRGLSHLAREGTKWSKFPLFLIHDLPYNVSKTMGLTKGGSCYNNTHSPIFYGYDC